MTKKIEQCNWKALFGEMPDSYEQKVRRTVQRMQCQDDAPARPRRVLALALVLVMLAGVAMALQSLGVLDTLSQNLREYLQPGASELVQSSIAQQGGRLKAATYTVEEAVNDGRRIYATVRVHATNPDDVLLIDEQADAAFGVDWWKEQNERAGQTYSQKAFDSGRDLVRATVWLEHSAANWFDLDSVHVHYDGEDILYTLSLMAMEDGLEEVPLEITTHNIHREDLPWEQRLEDGLLSFTVPVTDARVTYAADTPVSLPKAGLVLEVLEVEQTPIATYLTAQYGPAQTATDLQALNLRDGIWVNWLDEEGNPFPDGRSALGLRPAGEDGFSLTIAYRAMAELPETIILEFYHGMSKEQFDTITVQLEEKKGGSQ